MFELPARRPIAARRAAAGRHRFPRQQGPGRAHPQAVARVAGLGPAGPLERVAARGYQTQFSTLARVAVLIHTPTGVRFHPGHAWRSPGAMGLSCQRPDRRPIGRYEAAIGHWRPVGWPQVSQEHAAPAV